MTYKHRASFHSQLSSNGLELLNGGYLVFWRYRSYPYFVESSQSYHQLFYNIFRIEFSGAKATKSYLGCFLRQRNMAAHRSSLYNKKIVKYNQFSLKFHFISKSLYHKSVVTITSTSITIKGFQAIFNANPQGSKVIWKVEKTVNQKTVNSNDSNK